MKVTCDFYLCFNKLGYENIQKQRGNKEPRNIFCDECKPKIKNVVRYFFPETYQWYKEASNPSHLNKNFELANKMENIAQQKDKELRALN